MHQQWSLVSHSTHKPLFCRELRAGTLFLPGLKRSIDDRICEVGDACQEIPGNTQVAVAFGGVDCFDGMMVYEDRMG